MSVADVVIIGIAFSLLTFAIGMHVGLSSAIRAYNSAKRGGA